MLFVANTASIHFMLYPIVGVILEWSWGLAKWVSNGDNWDSYIIAYRGYLLSPPDPPSSIPIFTNKNGQLGSKGPKSA